MYSRMLALVLVFSAASIALCVPAVVQNGFPDGKPQTMREALRDTATARVLLVDAAFDHPGWSDTSAIAAAFGLRRVARWLPIVDRWQVGWFDTDGSFVADPSQDVTESLRNVNAIPLGYVIVDGIVNGGHFCMRVESNRLADGISEVRILDDGQRTMLAPEDVDGDGVVDNWDLFTVLANMDRTGTHLTRADGDLNGDRIVDAWDVLFVLKATWGL